MKYEDSIQNQQTAHAAMLKKLEREYSIKCESLQEQLGFAKDRNRAFVDIAAREKLSLIAKRGSKFAEYDAQIVALRKDVGDSASTIQCLETRNLALQAKLDGVLGEKEALETQSSQIHDDLRIATTKLRTMYEALNQSREYSVQKSDFEKSDADHVVSSKSAIDKETQTEKTRLERQNPGIGIPDKGRHTETKSGKADASILGTCSSAQCEEDNRRGEKIKSSEIQQNVEGTVAPSPSASNMAPSPIDIVIPEGVENGIRKPGPTCNPSFTEGFSKVRKERDELRNQLENLKKVVCNFAKILRDCVLLFDVFLFAVSNVNLSVDPHKCKPFNPLHPLAIAMR